MNTNDQISATVREICRRDELLAGMAEHEDFFDNGVSSLAVIQMQIRIEEALNVTVPTSDLMEQPTIHDWINLYTRNASAATEVATPAGIACDLAK